ncbi:polysaccharide biosynthesis protein [Shewanella decolorationis S12]|uniref:Polysaccharide biosynthesis protein n=1 Tax=Shewanella decolorationis S12 TaxID=1353536 RepID=A0ABP2Z3P5_9GAMM|nr:polysaccharide biosynthesis protein [Shewanella decolorationis S12]
MKEFVLSSAQNLQPKWLKLLPNKLSERLSGNHSLLAAINNSGWLMFDKLIRLVLGLLVSAWVARYLGPAQFGELAYVLAYLAFFQAVALLGMDGIVVRDIAKDKAKAGEILGTVFTLRLIVGFFCWLIAIAGMGLANGWHDSTVYITALVGAGLVFQAADTIDLWFQSQSQSKRTVIAKLMAYIISNGLKIILILNKAPLLAFALVMTIEFLLAALALTYAYRKFTCKQPWQLIKSHAVKLLIESWPFILGGLSIIIYMRIDQIMIKEMLGDVELGIYAAVLPLAMLWTFIPMTLSVSLAPMVARAKQQSEQVYWACLSNIFRGFALLGWLICIPVAIISSYAVELLFGSEYAKGSSVLAVLVFTNLLINMGVAQSLWILNEGKSKLSLYKTIVGAVVCLTSNLILIPQLGIIGAAISAVLAQLSSTILTNVILCRDVFILQIKSLFLIKYIHHVK